MKMGKAVDRSGVDIAFIGLPVGSPSGIDISTVKPLRSARAGFSRTFSMDEVRGLYSRQGADMPAP